jgi:RNA polymerase sigma-70 factor (ECF subfamily)
MTRAARACVNLVNNSGIFGNAGAEFISTAFSSTHPALASDAELSDFLRNVEKRAYKRSLYHVRDEDAALDIVQDSMMKLAVHYGDRPAAELPRLFQRILSTTTLDWFRRQKTRKALFSNLSDFDNPDADDGGGMDLLELLAAGPDGQGAESPEDIARRAQILHTIENEVSRLPTRQREAFLLRYWEEMDVAETATVMGCSEGSVKTHCSRAVHALAQALHARGMKP